VTTNRGVEYLSLDDVLALHDFIMERTDEPSAPLRLPDLLQSAMARAQQAAYYEDADLIRQACLLMVGIAQAQAFLSGNKRTAMLTALAFLDRNGAIFIGERELLGVLLEECPDIQPQERAISSIEAWVRRRCLALEDDEADLRKVSAGEDDDPW